MTSPETNAAVQAIAAFIQQYAITLAALGALTMAIIEAVKKVAAIQPKFHKTALEQWLQQHSSVGVQSVAPYVDAKLTGHYAVPQQERFKSVVSESDPYQWRLAYAELLNLTTGLASHGKGDLSDAEPFTRNIAYALFELDLPRLMSQVQEAAEAALSNPARYPHLFAFLTRGCDVEDVERWKSHLSEDTMNGIAMNDLSREEVANICGRIKLLMRRQLDAFQTVTAFRWREWNQFWAWGLGAVLMFLAQGLGKQWNIPWGDLPMMLLVSLAGGILAPVAKDLVDALARVKSNV